MIEVSEANSARRYPASLVLVHYGADLALVKVETPSMRLRLSPLELHDPISIDENQGDSEHRQVWRHLATDIAQADNGGGGGLEFREPITTNEGGAGNSGPSLGQALHLKILSRSAPAPRCKRS